MKPQDTMSAIEFQKFINNIVKKLVDYQTIEGTQNVQQPIDWWVDAFIEVAEELHGEE